MPKRLIDGEALWRSDKLAAIEPPRYRAEYANLLPLALADGTFEANPRRVWADVYSYNRSDITVEVVVEIIKEFERVGLIITRKDGAGKIWGKWTGIENHLPPESQRDRYKSGNSNLFTDITGIQIESRCNPDDIRLGEGLGFGLDLDRNRIGVESGQCSFKNISTRYASFFGVSHSRNKKHLEKYQAACSEYGEDKVLEYFDRWAATADWLRDKKDTNGLNLFWRPLDDLAAGDQLSKERESVRKTDETSSDVLLAHIKKSEAETIELEDAEWKKKFEEDQKFLAENRDKI